MKTNLSESKIVILAAGSGMRLKPFTDNLPKALVKIEHETLLDRALQFAASLAAGGSIVVGGAHFDLVEAHLRQGRYSPTLLLRNPMYQKGSILSMMAALAEIDSGFYVINVDHIYPSNIIQQLQTPSSNNITTFCDRGRPLFDDDMKVRCSEDPTRMIDISKNLREYDCGYIGISHIPTNCLDLYRRAISETLVEVGEHGAVEEVLRYLCNHGEIIRCNYIEAIQWHEIDTPEDYKRAKEQLKGE